MCEPFESKTRKLTNFKFRIESFRAKTTEKVLIPPVWGIHIKYSIRFFSFGSIRFEIGKGRFAHHNQRLSSSRTPRKTHHHHHHHPHHHHSLSLVLLLTDQQRCAGPLTIIVLLSGCVNSRPPRPPNAADDARPGLPSKVPVARGMCSFDGDWSWRIPDHHITDPR